MTTQKSKNTYRTFDACTLRPCWRPERKFTTLARREAHMAQGEAHRAYATKHAATGKPSGEADRARRGPSERQDHGGKPCFVHPGEAHDAYVARLGTTAPVSVTPAPAVDAVAEAERIVTTSAVDRLAEITLAGWQAHDERIRTLETFVESFMAERVA